MHSILISWHRRSWTAFAVGLILTSAPALGSDMGMAGAGAVSEASYRHFLDDELFTHYGHNRGFGREHDLAQEAIATLFVEHGLTVELEPVPYGAGTYYNVIGTKLGTLYPDQYYIVGAHYDSVGNPGADDDASGVALILEASRVLQDFDSAYTIRFIAFDREEQGLYGSIEYVDNHIDDDIIGMISADMVAFNKNGADRADIFGYEHSLPLKQNLEAAVTLYGDGLVAYDGGASGGSDHAPFEWEGFQACLFIEDWGNPYYHSTLDSVDTPDYIDYAYATKMTRSVVGFLVDHAEVQVPIADGDFNDDTFVDLTDYDAFIQCFTGPDGGPITQECEPGDFDYDNDIDCDDWPRFADFWTEPDDPPFPALCIIVDPLTPAWPDNVAKNRYISFDANNGDVVVAYEIELADSALFPDAVGIYGWVSAPDAAGVSEFIDQPYYTDVWPEVVQVADCEIVPAATYLIRGTIDAVLFSESLSIATTPSPAPKWWADICGPSDGMDWTPPNGVVNFDDVLAAMKAYQEVPPMPPLSWADIEAETPNRVCNYNDVLQVVLAFQGAPYPFGDPEFCP